MKSTFVALVSIACLLLGSASPAVSADFESAPRCPIGPNWNGEPLPIGCTTQLSFGGDKVGTKASSSDPGVVRAEFDAANNVVKVLTVGYGTAEVCMEHDPIQILAPAGSGDGTSGVVKVTQTQSCATYTVSPELAKNCTATETNAEGYEVSNMNIHVGCEASFGNAPGGPPVTRAWSSDPSILQVWVEGGRGQYRALAPGKATYCWTGVVNGSEGVLDPDYPVCFTEMIHPLTVNVSALRRNSVEPECRFQETDSRTSIHVGCSMLLSRYAGYSATSTDPNVVYPTQFGWLVASRTGQSQVCFAGAPDGHCIDITVFDPNQELTSDPFTEQDAPSSGQSSSSTPSADGFSDEESSEVVAPAGPEFTIKTKRNFTVGVRQVGDRLRLSIKTKLPARSKVRIISTSRVTDSTEWNRSIRTVKLNKSGNKRVFLPLGDKGRIRLLSPSRKEFAQITW